MQNRFGLKDFVNLVLLLAVGVSVWLGMSQRDRDRELVQEVRSKLTDVERQLSQVRTRLETGVVAAAPSAGGPARGGAAAGGAAGGPAGTRDESWARPGVGVQWQEPWGFVTDPRSQSGFVSGGEFTELFEVQPAKLTPNIQTDVYGRRVVDLVMDAMAAYDPATLKLRGTLAEAWQVDPKGLWLRVKLRDDARFSDGAPVTAEDVRWTFHEFVMNPQIEAERLRSTLETFDKVTVVSEKVVEFTFKDIYFSNVDSALTLFVLPKHFYSKFEPAKINQSTGLLMGSGPFRLERLDVDRQWAPPETVVLVRNEQYWGPRPSLDALRFKAVNDELARLTEYKNNKADMVTPSAPQFVSARDDKAFAASNQLLNWVNMRSGRSGIIWNCGPRPAGEGGKLTPFHDQRVRLAMTLLLDRERMMTDIWKGVGEVCKGFANPGTPGYDPSVKPHPLDPKRAMELLKAAGWEDRNGDRQLEDKDGRPFTFELTYFGGGEISERIAKFVQDSYAAAGIRVTLRPMDWSVGDPVRNQRDFDAMIMGWGANAPESDPKQIFHTDSIKGQGDNFAQWSDPRADAAMDAARREMDPVKRGALWREFEAAMHEGQPYTWIRVTPFTRFVKGDVRNVSKYAKGLELWEFWRGGAATPTSGN